jgi:hypothetical protein
MLRMRGAVPLFPPHNLTTHRTKIITLQPKLLCYTSVSETGFLGTLNFHRKFLGVPREIVE